MNGKPVENKSSTLDDFIGELQQLLGKFVEHGGRNVLSAVPVPEAAYSHFDSEEEEIPWMLVLKNASGEYELHYAYRSPAGVIDRIEPLVERDEEDKRAFLRRIADLILR